MQQRKSLKVLLSYETTQDPNNAIAVIIYRRIWGLIPKMTMTMNIPVVQR